MITWSYTKNHPSFHSSPMWCLSDVKSCNKMFIALYHKIKTLHSSWTKQKTNGQHHLPHMYFGHKNKHFYNIILLLILIRSEIWTRQQNMLTNIFIDFKINLVQAIFSMLVCNDFILTRIEIKLAHRLLFIYRIMYTYSCIGMHFPYYQRGHILSSTKSS